ncbi:MAG: IS4 family transposase [Paracoccaceae bacterium]|nr:IS4 family transposase [Paracoccaceae bacterium]MDE2916906.1 IS4 family transposase [Paracoccaceae bacterium]
MEQETSSFGDYRLDRANGFIHDRLTSHGSDGISVRRLGGTRAGEIRIGRFLRNGKVSEDRIIEPVAAATSSRVGGLHVLSIQDTTSFRDDGRGNSLVGHATIAVEAEQGALLGLLDTELIERRDDDPEPAPGRAFRDRRSYRWMASMKRSGELLGAASMVTVVADREADIYEMFACRPGSVEVLIRASHDRVVEGGAGKLFASLEGCPSEEHGVELPARPGQKKRTARLAVRFGSSTINHPRNRFPEEGVPRRQWVCLVEAFEVSPPKGVSPIHWRLLTSHDVSCFDQARWIIQLYRQRWIIEQLFRTIKTQGFDIEMVSMSTVPFRKLCVLTLVAGVSCLQLVQDRDGEGKRPLEDVFGPADQAALEAVSATVEGRTAKQRNPHPRGSLAFAAWVCARLGGGELLLWKTGPGCHAAGTVSIPCNTTWI